MPPLKRILLIHGPNLNMLGRRDSRHYGSLSLIALEKMVKDAARSRGLSVRCFQSNHEGDIIDFLQENSADSQGIIINAGALTHYSYALADALADADLPAVEVHLSDIKRREKWRRVSVLRARCIAQVSGKKEKGYLEALDVLVKHISQRICRK